MCIAHGKILAGEKVGEFGEYHLFAKNFPCNNIHRYTKNVFGICTDCNLFTKCFLTNTSYLYGSPKFSPVQYLYLNTFKSTYISLKYFSQNNAIYLYLYFNKCQSTFTCTSPHAWQMGHFSVWEVYRISYPGEVECL